MKKQLLLQIKYLYNSKIKPKISYMSDGALDPNIKMMEQF